MTKKTFEDKEREEHNKKINDNVTEKWNIEQRTYAILQKQDPKLAEEFKVKFMGFGPLFDTTVLKLDELRRHWLEKESLSDILTPIIEQSMTHAGYARFYKEQYESEEINAKDYYKYWQEAKKELEELKTKYKVK